jgi:hypothetical protein
MTVTAISPLFTALTPSQDPSMDPMTTLPARPLAFSATYAPRAAGSLSV